MPCSRHRTRCVHLRHGIFTSQRPCACEPFLTPASGIAGITSVKNLVEQGFEDVTGFERNDKIGGLWQFNEDPKQTTALKSEIATGLGRRLTRFQRLEPTVASTLYVSYERASARQTKLTWLQSAYQDFPFPDGELGSISDVC